MKPILLLVLLLPFALTAQKVKKVIEPITGQYWWITNSVSLGQPGQSSLSAYLRSSSQGTFIYLNPVTMEAIGAADIAVILTATDTIIARSTGWQPGNLSTYSREYRVTRSDLEKLTQSPVLKVSLTYFDGTEVVTVPEKRQHGLMLWAKALLQDAAGTERPIVRN